MRTRATGHSPGGFQVLASPKRVRRQPPPPVRASRASASDSYKLLTSDKFTAIPSTSIYEITKSNGVIPNHRSTSAPYAAAEKNKVPENQTPTPPMEESDSRSDSSQDKPRNDLLHNRKSNGIKKREALPKRTKSDRDLSEKTANKETTNDMKTVIVEVESNQAHHRSITQPHKSNIRKRQRSISPDATLNSKNFINISLHKRARTCGDKDQNQSTLSTVEPLGSVPLECVTLHPKTIMRDSQKIAHQETNVEPTRENPMVTLSSPILKSRKAQQQFNISSNPNSTFRTRSIRHNKASPVIQSQVDDRNDIETHLQQGMQSIMARINKYQYQPLPKNPYEFLISNNSAVAKSPVTREEKNQEKNDSNSTSRFSISANDESLESPVEAHKNCTLKSNETSAIRLSSDKKQNNKETELYDGDETKTSRPLKDRRMEVEKLFRTTAPNASYQNILRAVAEWAVHNSSALPTKDEIFKYIDSSKTPDAAELFSSADRSLIRGTPRSRVVGKKNSLSSTSARPKITSHKNIAERNHNHKVATLGSFPKKGTNPRHVSFSETTEIQRAKSRLKSPLGNRDVSISSPESPLISKTPQIKSFATQSWGLVNSLKSLVSTPFKALSFGGFGLNNNREAIQEVTKDMNFDFKPLATPTPSARASRTKQAMNKNHSILQAPLKGTSLKRSKLHAAHSSRQIIPRKSLITRHVVTEDRKAELQRELDLKKARMREKYSDYDTTDRHKQSQAKFKEAEIQIVNDSVRSNSSHSSQPTEVVENSIEEWPPNLDPNRPIVDLTLASQNLPHGPNGEDVATMLCQGWLISRHRDSFTRENRSLRPNQSFIENHVAPDIESHMTRSQEFYTGNSSKCSEADVGNIELSEEKPQISQPGRSYGFQYDDDDSSSGSDDEVTIVENRSKDSNMGNSSIKNIYSKLPLAETSSDVSTSVDKNPIRIESLQHPNTTFKQSSPSPKISYNSQLPSMLRNVETLSSQSKSMNPALTKQNHVDIPAQTTLDKSIVLFTGTGLKSQNACNSSDWSFMFDVDPRMAHFKPGIINAVESLPKCSFPDVQLPSLVEEII